jgi:hypothetical protein
MDSAKWIMENGKLNGKLKMEELWKRRRILFWRRPLIFL